jgi:hypothetical protein
MLASDTRPRPTGASPQGEIRAAFHDLHGRSVHGFALLLTLGDREAAGRLAADALAAAEGRVDELRHPERAAAWMRARIVRDRRHLRGELRPSADALAELGADPGVVSGLGALEYLERAALVASVVERLDLRDVAVVVGRDGSRLQRLLLEARRRYLAAYMQAMPDEIHAGPISNRLRDIARRAIG